MEAAMSSCSLIDAKLEEHRVCSSQQCPSCGHKLHQKPDWVGLPAGVKFDPTDQELIEHLEAKVKAEDLRSHPLIDEFIPTIEGEDGICYTHPEKLPGVRRDGLSKHFFHRPSKAYTTGTRKRRKIQSECDLHKGETRWHKTGKTRPVMVNGRQKGCKKILVLYTNFGKHRKPEKTNWVMHQYHLGESEEEKEGELVVCKIFYQTQPRQCSWSATTTVAPADHQRRDHQSTSTARIGSSSSKINAGKLADEHSSAGIGTNSGYGGMEMHQFAPFRESYNEVGMGEAAKPREDYAEQENRLQPPHHQRQAAAPATAAFHIGRPLMDPISAINVGDPPRLQQAPSIILEDPYQQVPGILLEADKFQREEGQHNLGHDRSASGLEELVMSCTSGGIKGETSNIPHSQEAEWHYPYWAPDHHG